MNDQPENAKDKWLRRMSLAELAATVSITEFVRLGGLVDSKCGKPWCHFDVIRVVRDENGIAAQVDTEGGHVFWIILGKNGSYIQRGYTSTQEAA